MDLMPTFLDLFGLPMPREVRATLARCRCSSADATQRDVGIFGMFGGPIGATDGRYTYFLYPEDLYAPGLHEYTLMPMHLSSLFSGAEMKTAKLAPPFDFTKGMPVLRIDALKDARRIPIARRQALRSRRRHDALRPRDRPEQKRPFRDAAIERRFHAGIAACCARTTRRPSSTTRYGVAGRRRLKRRRRPRRTRQTDTTEETMSMHDHAHARAVRRALLLAGVLAAVSRAGAEAVRRRRQAAADHDPRSRRRRGTRRSRRSSASTSSRPATGQARRHALRRHARESAQRGARRARARTT